MGHFVKADDGGKLDRGEGNRYNPNQFGHFAKKSSKTNSDFRKPAKSILLSEPVGIYFFKGGHFTRFRVITTLEGTIADADAPLRSRQRNGLVCFFNSSIDDLSDEMYNNALTAVKGSRPRPLGPPRRWGLAGGD